jgi:hypothetical protein
MPTPIAETRNLLIRAMSDDDLALLAPHFERVTLRDEETISRVGSSIDSVCFMEGGIASYASVSPSGVRTGIGIIGYEGMVEWHVLLGCDLSPYEVGVAVGGGTALRIAAGTLIDACRHSSTLHGLLMRFVQSFVIQLGQTAASNLNDPVERRLCRWLLMNHDRLEGDEIDLSHAEIGAMLGVRRASVTDTLHVLEGQGLIRSTRRRIAIRDRQRLRAAVGENYGVPEAEYARLICPFGKDG